MNKKKRPIVRIDDNIFNADRDNNGKGIKIDNLIDFLDSKRKRGNIY